MTKVFIKYVSLAVFIGCVLVRPAHASLMAVDTTFGPSTATRDSLTGFEWLDLNLTKSFSFDTLSPELEAGGMFEGYEIANNAQVHTLIFDNSGFTSEPGAVASNVWDSLLSLLGTTINDFSEDGSVLQFLGITGNTFDTSSGLSGHSYLGLVRRGLFDDIDNISLESGPLVAEFIGYPDDRTLNDPPIEFAGSALNPSGFWLVQTASSTSTIPEPNSIILLIIGLISLLYFRLKRGSVTSVFPLKSTITKEPRQARNL